MATPTEIKKEELESREVVKNQKVVKYEIPHGRVLPEIVEMTSLSDDKATQKRIAKAKAEQEKAFAEEAEQKEKAKKEADAALIAENEKVAKQKLADAKKG